MLQDKRPIPNWFQPPRLSEVSRDRRMLPHWHLAGGTYFVTFRQADSISRETQEQWSRLKKEWLAKYPKPWTNETTQLFRKTFSTRMENLLDAGYGSCHLGRERVRKILFDSMLCFQGERYHLDSLVIMPNHVHVIVAPLAPFNLSKILHTWKSFSSQEICREFKISAPFWLSESWDHLIRSELYLRKYRKYILDNPVKANLGHSSFCYWANDDLQARGL